MLVSPKDPHDIGFPRHHPLLISIACLSKSLWIRFADKSQWKFTSWDFEMSTDEVNFSTCPWHANHTFNVNTCTRRHCTHEVLWRKIERFLNIQISGWHWRRKEWEWIEPIWLFANCFLFFCCYSRCCCWLTYPICTVAWEEQIVWHAIEMMLFNGMEWGLRLKPRLMGNSLSACLKISSCSKPFKAFLIFR